MKTSLALVFGVALVVPSLAFAGTLIGDSVEGKIDFYGNSILMGEERLIADPQFTSPATVDATPTPEFSGTVKCIVGTNPEIVRTPMDWFVDVQSSQIKYSISPYGAGGDWQAVVIDLSDLDWVGAANDVISGYSVVLDEIGIDVDLNSDQQIGTSPHGIWVGFNPDGSGSNTRRSTIIALETFTIPEPGTFALLGMGAVGLLAYAWRRRHH
jgi:hypothetical protein